MTGMIELIISTLDQHDLNRYKGDIMKLALVLPRNLSCTKDFFSSFLNSSWLIRRIDTTPIQVEETLLNEQEIYDIFSEIAENSDVLEPNDNCITKETLKNVKAYQIPLCYTPYENKSYIFNINLFSVRSDHYDIPLFLYKNYFNGFSASKFFILNVDTPFHDIRTRIKKVNRTLNALPKPNSFRKELLLSFYKNPIKNMVFICEAYNEIEENFGLLLAVENEKTFLNIKNFFNHWKVRKNPTMSEIKDINDNFLISQDCIGYFLELETINDFKFY